MSIDFTAPRNVFHGLLDKARRVVENRNTIPILSNVRIEAAEGGRLIVIATDLDIEVSVWADGAEVHTPGVTTVPAKLVSDIVKRAKSDVRFAESDNGRVSIAAGSSGFEVHSLPATDYPSIEGAKGGETFSLPAEILSEIVDFCSFAISQEEVRYYLNGIYLHPHHPGTDDAPMGLTAVATDGHRLSRLTIERPDIPAFHGAIIPRKTVAVLDQVILDGANENDTVDLTVSDAKVVFEIGSTRLVSKLIDGTFPDYQRVIPQSNPKVAGVDRAALIEALEAVNCVASDRGRAVKFEFGQDQDLAVILEDREAGSAKDKIAVFYAGENPLTIGFQGRYVREALATFTTDRIELAMAEPGAPALLTDPKDARRTVVLMPMRVG